ncbi:hypothetical protein QQP08_011180 [Theobroma cacao]|nr:hypothetical protein QQP08_011180 [Theobroma cacao]
MDWYPEELSLGDPYNQAKEADRPVHGYVLLWKLTFQMTAQKTTCNLNTISGVQGHLPSSMSALPLPKV